MRAALYSEHGGPDVVRVAEVEAPEPGPGEVRLAVRAAAMNHLDLWARWGLPVEITMPHIGGADIAGLVESVGPGVEASAVGARVVVDPSLDYDWIEGTPRGPSFRDGALRLIGEHTQGGFAEMAVVPAANCLEIPEDVEFETAAAAGLVSVTAWRALVVRGGLGPGERVLVTGGSGGVATMAIQIARRAGARVFALTSGPENVRRVEALGAERGLDRLERGGGEEVGHGRDDGDDRKDPKDRDDRNGTGSGGTGGNRTDWVRRLKQMTGGGVDLVLDSVGQALWEANLRALAPGGRLVTYGATTGAAGQVEIRHVFWKQLSILGSTMGTPSEYRRVMGMVFRKEIEPVIHAVLPLDEARRAHEMLEEGNVFGKLVLVP